jgi:hypothetical protein
MLEGKKQGKDEENALLFFLISNGLHSDEYHLNRWVDMWV